MSIVDIALERQERELRKFIDWSVDRLDSDITYHIELRRDYQDPQSTLENKIRAVLRGFEEAYEEAKQRVLYLETRLAETTI